MCFLGVPLWMKDRANTFRPEQQADPRVKLLYRLKEAACPDENTGENPKDVQFRMVNARLMLDFEDRSDMEVLPLLRIKKGVGDDEGPPAAGPGIRLSVPGAQRLAGLARLGSRLDQPGGCHAGRTGPAIAQGRRGVGAEGGNDERGSCC